MSQKGFAPGQSGNPAGRPKGTPNKITKDLKMVFAELVDQNTKNLKKWLLKTAKDDPKAALDIVLKMSEFLIPKLSRTSGETTVTMKMINDLVGQPLTKEENEKFAAILEGREIEDSELKEFNDYLERAV